MRLESDFHTIIHPTRSPHENRQPVRQKTGSQQAFAFIKPDRCFDRSHGHAGFCLGGRPVSLRRIRDARARTEDLRANADWHSSQSRHSSNTVEYGRRIVLVPGCWHPCASYPGVGCFVTYSSFVMLSTPVRLPAGDLSGCDWRFWRAKKTPCPHHGRQGETSDGPDVRRRRQRGAPSAVESQCSSRQAPAAIPASRSGWALWSCGLLLVALVTRIRQSLSERLVVENHARRNPAHCPITDLLDSEPIVTSDL